MTGNLHFIDRPSPNKDARPDGVGVSHLILHYTGMLSAEEAVERLTDPEARVSAHYTIDESGRVFCHVAESERAWHAGVSHWRGETDINALSVGVEIANPGHEFGYRPFPEPQMSTVISLCKDVLSRHGIAQRNVIAHSDVAPARKMDPGELFPWARLASEGIGVWPIDYEIENKDVLGPTSSSPRVRELQSQFALYGYGVTVNGIYDSTTQAVVTAFQRHFRPHLVDGLADAETQAILDALCDLVDDSRST